MSVKDKMQEAKRLIQDKKYDQARKILLEVNHPKAQEWLAKLDKIAPQKKAKTNKNLKRLRIILAVVFGLLICGIIFFLVSVPRIYDEVVATVEVEVFEATRAAIDNPIVDESIEWCVQADIGSQFDEAWCESFIVNVYSLRQADFQECYDVQKSQMPSHPRNFMGCLADAAD